MGLEDVGRRCFAGLLPKALPKQRAWQSLRIILESMDSEGWDRSASSLGRRWMVTDGCSCQYREGTVSPLRFPPWMNEVMAACMPKCGLTEPETWPNSCMLDCYTDGSDGIDWHADDEALFQGTDRDCHIISLSLGETRTFELELRGTEVPGSGDEPRTCEVHLRHG